MRGQEWPGSHLMNHSTHNLHLTYCRLVPLYGVRCLSGWYLFMFQAYPLKCVPERWGAARVLHVFRARLRVCFYNTSHKMSTWLYYDVFVLITSKLRVHTCEIFTNDVHGRFTGIGVMAVVPVNFIWKIHHYWDMSVITSQIIDNSTVYSIVFGRIWK